MIDRYKRLTSFQILSYHNALNAGYNDAEDARQLVHASSSTHLRDCADWRELLGGRQDERGGPGTALR